MKKVLAGVVLAAMLVGGAVQNDFINCQSKSRRIDGVYRRMLLVSVPAPLITTAGHTLARMGIVYSVCQHCFCNLEWH